MASVDNFVVPSLMSIKQDDASDWFHCQFCTLIFGTFDEYKAHSFDHFNVKTCSECNVHLIQICNEWYELHSTSNCHNNSHAHSLDGNGTYDNGDELLLIKQELQADVGADHLDDLLNVKTDVDLADFGEIFAANLSTENETCDNPSLKTSSPHGPLDAYQNDFQPAFRVINFTEINKSVNDDVVTPKRSKGFQCRFCDMIFGSRFRLDCHIQSHHHDKRIQTSCKHCEQSFSTFQQLDRHLRRCAWNIRKREYLKGHPHRPAGNFICDLCGSTLKKFRTLIDHMNEVHSTKFTFKCRICGRRYPSRYYLAKHINRHKQAFENDQQNHEGDGDMDKELIERRKYNRVHPHRPQMHFVCDLCGREISRYDMLEEHMSTFHSAADSFRCRLCDRVYPSRYYLSKHMLRHKSSSADGAEVDAAEDFDKGLMERNKYIRTDPSTRHLSLTCDECGRVFKHQYLLMEHKSSRHSGKSSFPCRKCGRLYPNRYYLTKHMKRHEEADKMGIPAEQLFGDLDNGLMQRNKYVRPEPNDREKTEFKCDECGRTFKKFCLLTEHKRSKHSGENGFPCRKCGRRYPNRYYLTKHMKRHENSNETATPENHSDRVEQIDLTEGDLRGDDERERRPYVRNHPHHPKSDFTCESCGMVYKRYELLKEHMTSNHSSKASFKCNICHRLYPNRYYLQKHMKRHSSKSEKANDNLDEDLMERNRYIKVHPHRPVSNFVCDICQKVLSSYYSMKLHMRSRHTRKNKVKHACSKCKKLFVSKKRLKKHEDSKHPDVPPEEIKSKAETKHMCSICGRLFPDRSKMISHEKTHFGIMASCDICGKKFLHKNYLRKHIKSVHAKERPFSCNIDGCEWTFAYQQCMQRHQARKHGMVINRNPCPICFKEFPDSTYHLKRHLKAHANNTAKEYTPALKPKLDIPT